MGSVDKPGRRISTTRHGANVIKTLTQSKKPSQSILGNPPRFADRWPGTAFIPGIVPSSPRARQGCLKKYTCVYSQQQKSAAGWGWRNNSTDLFLSIYIGVRSLPWFTSLQNYKIYKFAFICVYLRSLADFNGFQVIQARLIHQVLV